MASPLGRGRDSGSALTHPCGTPDPPVPPPNSQLMRVATNNTWTGPRNGYTLDGVDQWEAMTANATKEASIKLSPRTEVTPI